FDDDHRTREFGPQGAALILELQRLRQAFEAEDGQARKPSRRPKPRSAEPPPRRPKPPPKRKRKSRMSKAIDVCLQQFGLKPPPAPPKPAFRPSSPPIDIEPVPPRRPASPTIAPDDLLAMDLTKLAPEIPGPFELNPSIGLEARGAALP